METETAKQETPTAAEPERTFTQTELNAIVADRLSREKGKYADYEDLKAKAAKFDAAEEAAKSELQKAAEKANALQAKMDEMLKADSIRQIREKVSNSTGVPISLLSGETEEACKVQADAIMAFAKPHGYPNVRDGGEVHQTGKAKTRDQFADWFAQTLGTK